MQILNTLQGRHKYNVVHLRWVMSTKKFPFLYYISSSKMKGYNLQEPYYTSSSHSYSLSHTITEIVLQWYNTINNSITILSFYRGIIMGNTTGHPIPWVCKLLSNKHPKNFFWWILPHTPQLGWVYGKNGVQTQLNNNIFESGRSGSTTNNLCMSKTWILCIW